MHVPMHACTHAYYYFIGNLRCTERIMFVTWPCMRPTATAFRNGLRRVDPPAGQTSDKTLKCMALREDCGGCPLVAKSCDPNNRHANRNKW